MQKKFVFALFLSVFIALFAILNSVAVPINLIFLTINISAALVILISASVGAMIVYFFGTVSRFKIKKTCKDLEDSKTNFEREIRQLKGKNKQLELEIQQAKERDDSISEENM